jgi:transposase
MCHMATTDKKSLREEAERIKSEFDRLAAGKKISGEAQILFQSMLMLINLLIAIFLEKTTKKNSKNSSTPPSKTSKDESSTTQTGSNGKGKLEANETADNTRTVETVTLNKVTKCDICGKDLSRIACSHLESRRKIDIVFEKIVERVDAQVKVCTDCGATVKGRFPPDMPGPLQYGNGLKAYVINLIVCQMISLIRVQGLVKSIIGEIIAQATLLKFVLRLHQALEAWEDAAVEQLLKSPAMNVDETSLRVDKKNHWIHVYSAGDITLKFLHRKRGKEAIDEINIIPRYSGIIVHDCWSSYFAYNNCADALCGAHLVRELTAAIESNDYSWAANMKVLLLETCGKISKRKRKKLNEREYANLQKRYRNIITRGESELPSIPAKPEGKRGVMAKSDAHNLWERLKDYETAVLLFAKIPEVPFTNNRAERDLRMAKVKQKVSGCFRSEVYAKAYCRISSYLQTMASQGVNPLIAIQRVLNKKVGLGGGE